MNSEIMLKWVTFLAMGTGAPYHYIEGIQVNHMSSTNHVGSPRLALGENRCKLACPRLFMWARVNQPVHWFLGGKGLGIQQATSVWIGSPKSFMWRAYMLKNAGFESKFGKPW